MARQVHSQASTDVKDRAKQMVLNKTAFVARAVGAWHLRAWRLSCSEAHLAKKLVPGKQNLGVQNFAAESTIHVQNILEQYTRIYFLDDSQLVLAAINGFRSLPNYSSAVNWVKFTI